MLPSSAISRAIANSRSDRSMITAPAFESRDRARWNAAATVRSRSSSTTVCGTPILSPATGRARPIWPRALPSAASRRRQQSTERAIGPSVSSVGESGTTPAIGCRPAVGLNPVSPHSAAGMRTDPAVSVPIAATAMPSVTETAAPEDEPPGMRSSSRA